MGRRRQSVALKYTALDKGDDTMPRWSVDTIRKRAEHLGMVVAANESEAIKVAVATFDIEPARRNRITVIKISNNDDDEA